MIRCVAKMFSAVCVFGLVFEAGAATRFKDNNTTSLNVGASWVGGSAPGANDVALWSNNVLSANAVLLGGNMSLQGLWLTSPGGTVAIGGNNTLTLGFRGVNMSAATQDLILTNQHLTVLDYACPVLNVALGRTLTLSPSVFVRGTNATLSVQGSGSVAGTALANDATGIVGPWARYGAGTATRYAAVSGGVVVGGVGTAAASAADVTDLSGTVNYDVAAAGTLGAGASFNTLRYASASGGTIAGGYAANGLLNASGGVLTLSGSGSIGAGKELVLTSPDTTRRIDVAGSLSDHAGGASGIAVTGGGQVRLTAGSTYSGVTAVGSGSLFVSHPDALGSTNGGTVIYVNGSPATGGQMQLSGNLTLAEPLVFVGVGDGDPWSSALTVAGGGGTNTLTGRITIPMGNGVRLTAGGSGTALNINGPIVRTGSGTTLILGANSGTLNVNYPINNNGGQINLHSGPGLVRFNVAGNNIGSMNVQWGHQLQLGVSDALAVNQNLLVGDGIASTSSAKGAFDLAGFNQTVNGFYGDGAFASAPPSTRVVTNSAAGLSLFTIGNANGGGTFNGTVAGNLALVKNGTGTEILCGPNAYTGGTTVNGGTLVLSNAVNHGALTVNGGTFRFPNALAVNGSLAGLGGTIDTLAAANVLTVNQTSNSHFAGTVIGGGSLIKAGPGALTLSGANTYTGGTTVTAGMLCFAKPASIPASGTITVAPGAGVGLGLGGTGAFTAAELDALWAGTMSGISLDSAALIGIDTSLGDASYATDQATRGLVKTGTNTLTLSGANTYPGGTWVQAGVLSIPTTASLPGWNLDGRYWVSPAAGLAVGNAVSDGEFATIMGTTNFAAWACIGFDTTVGNRTFGGTVGNTVNGALGLVKVGTNTLTLTAASAYDGHTYVNGGRLVVRHSDALGTTNGYTVVNRVGGTNAWFTDSTGQLQLDGSAGALTIGEAFIINGDQQYGYAGALRSTSGNNVLNGSIVIGPSGRIGVDSGTLTLNGTISRADASYNPMLVLSPNSAMIVSNVIDIGSGLINFHSGGTLTLCSRSNTWGSAQIQYGSIVRLGVDDAMAVGKTVWLGNNEPGNGRIDLFGYSQTLGGLQEYGTAASKLNNVVTNGRPERLSTLTLNMAGGVTNLFGGRLSGAVSLVKSGAPNSMMTLWGTNTLSGDVTVSGGTLALNATGTLGLFCTNVTVTGGVLAVQNSAAVADSAVVYLATGGVAKIDLAAGVNEKVRYLYFGDKMQRAGTHGSMASTATYRSDTYFSGTGVLTVQSDHSGSVLMLR